MTETFIKRSRFEVIYQILSFCQNPRQKTHILYRCNLSYEQLKKYMEFLVTGNLLKKTENDRELYQATQHGEKFIGEYERLRRILEEAKKEYSS